MTTRPMRETTELDNAPTQVNIEEKATKISGLRLVNDATFSVSVAAGAHPDAAAVVVVFQLFCDSDTRSPSLCIAPYSVIHFSKMHTETDAATFG